MHLQLLLLVVDREQVFDHAMETLKNKVDQVNTDKAQPNYTEASTDKKEAVDQALQAA
ncbi:hypothetical protein, partial [Staphylococcus aureus]|uniref:hypothetical protein n=1 Tax=Staphylococcus aureus TaxID=1280 RepID=UPI003F559BBD